MVHSSTFTFKCVLIYVGIPGESELKKLSQLIVYALKSEKKSNFKTGTAASNLRINLASNLGVPFKKMVSIQLSGWPAIGNAVEITRFCKFFEVWKATSDQPVRVCLVAALIESPISNMIPRSLEESFSNGIKHTCSYLSYI